MGLLEKVKNYPGLSAAVLVMLGIALATPQARRTIRQTLHPEKSPTAQALNPDGSRIPAHIRTQQLISEIERKFPLLKQTLERNTAEMDRLNLPHLEAHILLAPFRWVEGNARNASRNIEQLRYEMRNRVQIRNQEFFYGLLPEATVRRGAAFASYNPQFDTIQLPESFDANEMLDLLVLYHELWHRIRKANLEAEMGEAAYEQEQRNIAERMRNLPNGYTRYCELDDEAMAHYMEVELLNVLLKGRLQQTRGNISLVELAETLETEHPDRISALRTAQIAARALYESSTVANPAEQQYPPEYLQALIDIHAGQRILMYRLDSDGSLLTFRPSGGH